MLIKPHRIAIAAFALVAVALSLLASACGSSSGGASGGVTIEALSPTPASTARIGGKPAAPPRREAEVASPEGVATEAPAETPDVSGASLATETAIATSTPVTPVTSDGSVAPTEGRWIDVDVTTYAVRLMDGTRVMREIAPVGVGVEVDTGIYASTQTGLFHVYNKVADLVYDPPYDTYISHWVGFDPDKANGFHSLLKDKDGKVVDASTGRVSNGCIRTGAAAELFAFAEIGMPVWVHW